MMLYEIGPPETSSEVKNVEFAFKPYAGGDFDGAGADLHSHITNAAHEVLGFSLRMFSWGSMRF